MNSDSQKNSPPILQFSDVTFGYQDKIVLTKINFSLHQGEFVGILGPNGAGKTTLLKCCNRIYQPQNGEIFVQRQPLARLSQHQIARTIAMVQQETQMVFPYTVFEVIMMGRHPYIRMFGFETAQDVAIVQECMAMMDVQHLAHRSYDTLSGGEKQRTIVASALAQTPTILLLDEPTSALDLKHQIAIYDILKRAQRERALTILSVTHDVNLACMFCDRLILLKDGKIMNDGPSNEVVSEQGMNALYELPLSVIRHPIRHTPMVIAN